jgi:Ca-activated chloride channel family protein
MTRILIILLLLIPQETLRVKVSLVTVGVRVMDSRGRSVTGLKMSDFSIFDDASPQRIEFFSDEEQPITLGILVDRSFSMSYNDKLQRAKDAAQALLRAAHEGSEYFYIPFDDQVQVGSDFTTDRQRIAAAIDRTRLGGGTSLYDAVVQAISMCGQTQLARQAIIVISDGADQHSKRELQETMRIVRESEMQIYTIGYYGPEEERLFRMAGPKVEMADGRTIDNPRTVLEKIAKESGAVSFFPRSDAELTKAIEEIANDLRTQYTLSFYPQAVDAENRYHQLRVTVQNPKYRVRARPGYGTVQVEPAITRQANSRAFERKVERRNGRVFYQDDFTDPNSGWPDRVTARYTRDGYKLAGDNVVAVNGPVFRNFRASVSLNTDGGAGLVFRQSDRGFYTFAVSPEFAVVTRVEAIKATELNRWSLDAPNTKTRNIEVRCDGSDCAFYQDEMLIGRINDSALSEGRVGLHTVGKANAAFKDLKVEEIQ